MNSTIRSMRRLVWPLAVALVPLLSGPHALAQSGKTLVMRVAYPPGGPADVAARKIQVPLQTALGQTVIVENVPGAGGSIGASNVLNAPADGQTLLVTTGNDLILAPMAIAQARYKSENYRLLANIFPTDFALVTNADRSFSSLDDLVERSRGGKTTSMTVGSWGHGSAPYLVAADFSSRTGVQLLDIPYKGAAPVIQALLSREIDLAFVPVAPSVLELIRTGRIKPIGVSNSKRNPFLPQVPTLSEGKYLKDFVYSAWAAVFISASVPEPIAVRLNQQLATITASDDFQKFLQESAALPVEPMTLPQASAYLQKETDNFKRIAKLVKLEPQ